MEEARYVPYAAQTRIVVLFGGSSPEHDVSVISASQLMDAVDVRHFEVIPVHMGWDNLFRTGASLRDISLSAPACGLKLVQFGWGDRGAQMVVEGQEPLPIDCVLPVFHGTYGEDGRVQAYFELLRHPRHGVQCAQLRAGDAQGSDENGRQLAGVEVLDQVVIRREDARDAEAAVQAVEAGFGFRSSSNPPRSARLSVSVWRRRRRSCASLWPAWRCKIPMF